MYGCVVRLFFSPFLLFWCINQCNSISTGNSHGSRELYYDRLSSGEPVPLVHLLFPHFSFFSISFLFFLVIFSEYIIVIISIIVLLMFASSFSITSFLHDIQKKLHPCTRASFAYLLGMFFSCADNWGG